MTDMAKIAALFRGWDKAMILSCLQGYMGYAIVDNEQRPSAAQIVIGDICFFAGAANPELAAKAAAPIIVPQTEEWGRIIETVWNNRVYKALRYAIKKEPDVFNIGMLTGLANSLKYEYSIKLIDEEIFGYVLQEDWSRDLCSQFTDYNDYQQRGLGVVVLYQGKPVSGASSYVVYSGGIEIEIDTKPEFRKMGLATACGARLILECLQRGLYPGWDAHDLRSVALAEKLGYHAAGPYPVYIQNYFH